MSEQQDVLDPRRPRRRRIPVILLGILPAAIAATILIAGPQYVAPVKASTTASGGGPSAATVTRGVVAPTATVNLAASVQQITVTLPTAQAATPVAKTAPKTTAKAKSKKASSTKTAPKKSKPKASATKSSSKAKKSSSTSTGNYKAFCADPSNPVSTSGSTGKALLTAVNKERAKLGIAAMSWSSSMASIATAWSKHMVAADEKTSKLIDGLAHNPKRPGAENVAVVYSSTGYSAAAAINRMHTNLVYSEGHCLNLMNPSYTSMGAGVASTDDHETWYATENFR